MQNFDSQSIADILFDQLGISKDSRFFVAFSGGMDSMALLHVVSVLRDAGRIKHLGALHCNHGISFQSNRWESRCEQICRDLEVEFDSARLRMRGGWVSEGVARDARYDWLRGRMAKGCVLLTAHHQSDQAETLILNLVRGASPRGLSAMQPVVSFNGGLLIRPMLDFSRRQIAEYVERFGLRFIEDPANENVRYSRNFVRSRVISALEERWPSAVRQVAQAARLMSEARIALEELADEDIARCATRGSGFLSEGVQLRCSLIGDLSRYRQVNLLRCWIRRGGLPEPPQSMLDDFIDRVVRSRSVSGKMQWRDHSVRKFKGNLYLVSSERVPDSTQAFQWDLRSSLAIKSAGIRLHPVCACGAGLCMRGISQTAVVRFRTGGERIILPGRTHSSKVKKLLSESSIPTWERKVLPLIYFGDDLALVSPDIVSAKYAAKEGQNGITIQLEPI